MKKCEKCGSNSDKGISDYGYNNLCSYCAEKLSANKFVLCHYCECQIWPQMSRYEGHNRNVCQNCFKDKSAICFNCKYPIMNTMVQNSIANCEFCEPELIAPNFSIKDMNPILAFVDKYWQLPKLQPDIQWITINRLIELQSGSSENDSFNSMDVFIQSYYPVWYSNNVIYSFPDIVRTWFIPYFAGQMVISEIYTSYKIQTTNGQTPFDKLVIGWGQYFTFLIAKLLKNETVQRFVDRFPYSIAGTDFLKLKAMGEYRKHSELRTFIEENLSKYAEKYYKASL